MPVLFAFLMLLLAPNATFGAARDLQAHGSNERVWFARSEPLPGKPSAFLTTIYVREAFKPEWRRLVPVGTRVAGMASRGSQLALLLEGGDWRLLTDTGFASGRPLPGGARMVAIGGDADGTLWAVARIKSGQEVPASQPSIAEAVEAATQPTTAPSEGADREALFRLEPAGWQEQGELPGDVGLADANALSLGIVNGIPHLAHRVGPKILRIYQRTPDKAWGALPDIESSEDVAEFKLIGGAAAPVLWFRGASGAGRLWLGGSGAKTPVLRDLEVPGNVDHAVTFANDDLRLIWIEAGKIMYRPLAADTGLAKGDLSVWPVPAESMVPVVWRWIQVTLTGALIVAFVASMRRRREMQEAAELDPAKLRLAPLSTRLTAGVIDAIPVLVTLWIAWPNAGDTETDDLEKLITVGIGFGIYLVLTTIIEAVVGRSLGKLFTGLHVVGLDGKPASLGARVLRNVLRIIDIPIMPLALILFSPLRQRAGDLAAGTLVVRGKDETDAERVGQQGKEQKDEG